MILGLGCVLFAGGMHDVCVGIVSYVTYDYLDVFGYGMCDFCERFWLWIV